MVLSTYPRHCFTVQHHVFCCCTARHLGFGKPIIVARCSVNWHAAQDLAALIWCLSKLSGEVSDKLPALLSVLTHQALRHLRAPTPAASLLQILHIVQG